MHKAFLDFLYVSERHTGPNRSARIIKLLHDFSIAHKILGITTDEGANIVAFFETESSFNCSNRSELNIYTYK